MVFNALKRLIKPEYRVVYCTELKIYHLQKRTVISGRWEYVIDYYGIFALEFYRYSDARDWAKSSHRFRNSKICLLVVNKCDA